MKERAHGVRRQAAGGLLSFVKLRAAWLLLPACALVMPPAATAQVLSDPTRPPLVYLQPADGAAAASGPVLQSVMISGTDKSAIIGGETVKLGGKFGDARVVAISESEVVLRSAAGTETLRMYPDVGMKLIQPAPPETRKPARKKRAPAANTQGKQG